MGEVLLLDSARYGASITEWAHFDLVLGLTADLLPVVSNPLAQISKSSKLSALGKVPSSYNQSRTVSGMYNWPEYQASDDDIRKWCREKDYGICVQTRVVRAIDVDITDPGLAATVADFIEARLGRVLPKRMRANSPKFLLTVSVPGEFEKTVLTTAAGNIEFLGNGQQFIACGTHPSGARYEWQGGLPGEIPAVTQTEFRTLILALQGTFGTGPLVARSSGSGKEGGPPRGADPVTDYLVANGWMLDSESDGSKLHIRCPFEADHTTDGGVTGTSYFPPGGEYEVGHFKCLHAHCAQRSDDDFLHAVGYTAQDFEVVQLPAEAPAPVRLERDKFGKIKATVGNLAKALEAAELAGAQLGLDSFREEVMLRKSEGEPWQAFTDADYTELRVRLERGGFKPIGRELVRDVVHMVAKRHRFDSAQNWLNSLVWDGVPRVEGFLHRYFRVEDSEYSRAISYYLWTAMAGRVLVPGIKADMVPVLIGMQGTRKSTALATLVPHQDHFVELSLDTHDDNQARLMRGRLVGEIAELRGLSGRDDESIKAFIARTHERWVPKYQEFPVNFPRRIVMIGTTNQDEFLADETGNRRWLPVRCGKVDDPGIERDRDQLWAEGRERFGLFGIEYQDAERLAPLFHVEHMIQDSWSPAIQKWLETEPENEAILGGGFRGGNFTISDVLAGALGLNPQHMTKAAENRAGKILRALGCQRVSFRNGKNVQRGWVLQTGKGNVTS